MPAAVCRFQVCFGIGKQLHVAVFFFRTSSVLACALLALRAWTALCGVREAGGIACQHGIPSAWMAREGAPALSGEGRPTVCALRRGRYYLGSAVAVWPPQCLQPAGTIPFSGSLCSARSSLLVFIFCALRLRVFGDLKHDWRLFRPKVGNFGLFG